MDLDLLKEEFYCFFLKIKYLIKKLLGFGVIKFSSLFLILDIFLLYVLFVKVRLRLNVSLYYFYDFWVRCLICNYIRDSMIILYY